MTLFHNDALLASDLSHKIIKVDDIVLHLNVINPTRQKYIPQGSTKQIMPNLLVSQNSLCNVMIHHEIHTMDTMSQNCVVCYSIHHTIKCQNTQITLACVHGKVQ